VAEATFFLHHLPTAPPPSGLALILSPPSSASPNHPLASRRNHLPSPSTFLSTGRLPSVSTSPVDPRGAGEQEAVGKVEEVPLHRPVHANEEEEDQKPPNQHRPTKP
jgi:hypothetical protein